MTFEIGTWIVPLILTVTLFAWTFSIKPHADYDFTRGIAFMFSLAVSATAWIVWAITALFGG